MDMSTGLLILTWLTIFCAWLERLNIAACLIVETLFFCNKMLLVKEDLPDVCPKCGDSISETQESWFECGTLKCFSAYVRVGEEFVQYCLDDDETYFIVFDFAKSRTFLLSENIKRMIDLDRKLFVFKEFFDFIDYKKWIASVEKKLKMLINFA